MKSPFLMLTALCLLTAGILTSPAQAQQSPVFDYHSIMNTYFDNESGLISFTEYNVAWAPEPPFNGQVVVVNSENTVVASFKFFEDYRFRDGVFARAKVVGPADVTLTDPGIYNIVFMVDGKMTTRLPVKLEQTSAGDDPFDPVKKFRFDGLWRKYAYLTMGDTNDGKYPKLHLWLGGIDLAEGTEKDMFTATLLRDGKVVAHSKRTQGFIPPGHFRRTDILLFQPHEDKNTATAEGFLLKHWLVDGTHELRITRRSDGALLRSFDFDVKDGKFVPLTQTQLGYEPGIDYIMPRLQEHGASNFEMVEAIWLMDKP